jgi:hypothetical protein
MLTNPPTKPQPKQAHETMNRLPVIKVMRKMTATNTNAIKVIKISRLVTMSRFLQRVEGVSTESGPLAEYSLVAMLISSDYKISN